MIQVRQMLMVLGVMVATSAAAQQVVNTKFGKPTDEEMAMTVYDADSTAEAVVLCRLTDVAYTIQFNGYLVDYREKIRIKVLKPGGERYAKVTIPFMMAKQGNANIGGLRFSLATQNFEIGAARSDFDTVGSSMSESSVGDFTDESVEELKATAYNLVNGKRVKSVLKKSEVKTEQIGDEQYQVSFTIPDVRVGTVIEYEYCLHSQLFWLLHDWYAQREIPVAFARLDMVIPRYLVFNIEEHGIQRLKCTTEQGSLHYKLESDPLAAPKVVTTNHYVFVGRNFAAIPADDYTWCPQDHCAGITAELRSYSLRGTMQMDYAKTWEQIDQMVLDTPELGKQMGEHSPFAADLKTAGIADIANYEARAVAVFKFITERVKWDGTYALWPAEAKTIVSKGQGTNVDVNLLLIQALREVGLEADPVVLRTRNEGLIPYNFPSIIKLSSFVVAITSPSGTTHYVDASSVNGYLDVLPEPLLVERARLMKKGKKSQWVNLQQLKKSETITSIEATLTADGKVSGTQTTLYKGLAALRYRQQKGLNDFAPEVEEKREISYQGAVSDGRISIPAFAEPPLKEQPFPEETRLTPVEYPCVSNDQVVVSLALPEGYTFAGKPQSSIIVTTDKSLDGRFVTQATDHRMNIRYQFSVNKPAVSEKLYADVRNLYDLLLKAVNTPLEFVKP